MDQRIVIVGASSAIAEHCTRLLTAGKAVDLTLVGRDASRLEGIAADLRVRSPQSDIAAIQADFLDPDAIQATVDGIVGRGPVDIVLIAHGFLPDQADCQDDLKACRKALEINGISPVLYAEAFARHMAKNGHGTLVLVGSVAGDRGRRSNYVYGAAKGLVTRYMQGLQHRFAGTGVTILLVKPGPTDTPMTAKLKATGVKLAPVEEVARDIVAAIREKKSLLYTPGRWKIIMGVIRHLPGFIFNRMHI